MPEHKLLLRVKLCADCGRSVTTSGGHIHKRFSPVKYVDAVKLSDLPAIEAVAAGEERERLREAVTAIFDERLDATEEDSLGASPESRFAGAIDRMKKSALAALDTPASLEPTGDGR
jgi:hypothetical protein